VQLRAALQEPGGAVPGFMKVCDCLVTRKGSQGAFSGMLMEELHGGFLSPLSLSFFSFFFLFSGMGMEELHGGWRSRGSGDDSGGWCHAWDCRAWVSCPQLSGC
jgi:hypothetical protein